MKLTFCLTFALLLVAPAHAESQTQGALEDEEQREGEALEFFDGDGDVNDEGWPRFALGIGYMALDADGTFDVQTQNGDRVTIIDLDRLGVDDKDGSIWATLKWRSRESNWGAWGAYWSFSGAGFRTWEDELDLGDGVVIPVGAAVATEISTDWYIVEATYSFLQSESWDVGIGAGFHVVDVDTTLAVGAQAGDVSGVEQVVNLDTLAPLPNILGYARWKINDHWVATARYGWFGLTYDKYDGAMTNLHALINYNFNDRWGLEAGYQFVDLNVDVNEDKYTAIYDMSFEGPMAVFRYYF